MSATDLTLNVENLTAVQTMALAILQAEGAGSASFPTTSNIAFGASSVRGIGNEIWIGIRTDGKAGSGTSEDPFDGSTQSKFDTLMASFGTNMVIHLTAPNGTFVTKGSLFWAPKSGWKLYLSQGTTIQLAVLSSGDISGLSSAKGLGIFYGNALTQDILVDGGIWDMNIQNQTQQISADAIQLVCNGLTVRNAKFINWGNISPNGSEMFLVGNFSNGSRDNIIMDRGVVFDGLEFTQPAAVTGVATITLANPCGGQNVANNTTLSNGWFHGVTVRNCFFHDYSRTDNIAVDCINIGGWVQGFHGHHNRFTNLTGLNARYCYYLDTGSALHVQIEHDDFDNVSQGVTFLPSGTPPPTLSDINISKEMSASTSWAAINLIAGTATITNVTIDGNVFNSASTLGVQVNGVTQLRIKNNVIDSGTAINNTSSTILEQFSNTLHSGAAVTGAAGLQLGTLSGTLPDGDIVIGNHNGGSSQVTRIRTTSYNDNPAYGFYLKTNYSSGSIATFGTRDSSTDTDALTIKGGVVSMSTLALSPYTVATLPTGTQGAIVLVTDAISPTYLGSLMGGGSTETPVFYDSSTSTWRSF